VKFPRFTVRWLMVAVAIVAVGFGLLLWMQRRAANFRDREARHLQAWLTFLPYLASNPPAKATYHWNLVGKYNHAARYPWLPVEPDTPEPE
jgi:hypothetical protein